MTPPRKYINFPFAILKEIEIYKLSEKELSIIILRKLSSYQRT